VQSKPENRVLLDAPTARDGQITRALLAEVGLECVVCSGMRDLCAEIEGGVGALLLTEESLASEGFEELAERLSGQPSWSDIPAVVLIHSERDSALVAEIAGSFRNVTLLDRPAPTRSVVSAVEAAVRARQRQYQIRDQIIKQHRMMDEREVLLASERAARAEAEQAGRLKDEFLATLSHELRTPLNAILGWSQILRRHGRAEEDDMEEGLGVIERNARVQAQLIEDLLDMSRIVSGKLRLDVQPVEIAEVTNEAVESVRPMAEAKQIKLQKMIDSEVGVVRGDAARLQQVVWNLLSNAIKFTPVGGWIQVGLQRIDNYVEISVRDNGVGIKAEFLSRVFDRFRQADASTTRRHGGLGLGLAIVKNLVELHSGKVRVTSEGEGKGSTFFVDLPLAAIHSRKPGRNNANYLESRADLLADEDALRGVVVLVVDDEEDARRLISRVLEESKAKVVVASSGAEAREILAREHPSVLLSDIGMPDEDGYEFIKRVRMLSDQQGGRTPAAALTAFARSEDRTRALRAGYQTHIAKPVEPIELVAVVASLAGRRVPSASTG